MGMDITGLGAVADLATTAINKIWPDKTEQEKAEIAAAVQVVTGQMDIDKAEAQSTDPLQHWRGGLGWVCSAAYFWNFVGQPLITAFAVLFNHPVVLPPLDIGPLATLTMGMLGLGGLHVAERVNSK